MLETIMMLAHNDGGATTAQQQQCYPWRCMSSMMGNGCRRGWMMTRRERASGRPTTASQWLRQQPRWWPPRTLAFSLFLDVDGLVDAWLDEDLCFLEAIKTSKQIFPSAKRYVSEINSARQASFPPLTICPDVGLTTKKGGTNYVSLSLI